MACVNLKKIAVKEMVELLEARLPTPGEQKNLQIDRKEAHQSTQHKVQISTVMTSMSTVFLIIWKCKDILRSSKYFNK